MATSDNKTNPNTQDLSAFTVWAPITTKNAEGAPATITATCSSDLPDRGNDRFATSCLHQMAEQVVGLTLFIQHQYAPEDAAGTIDSATVIKVGDHHELLITATLDTKSPRVAEIWRQIQAGIRLGLSVGCMVKDAGFEGTGSEKRLVIKSVEMLEVTIVGLAANRESSWIQRAFDAASYCARRSLASDGQPTDMSELSAAKSLVGVLLFALRQKDEELEEMREVTGSLMVHVNKLLDLPMPRKTDPSVGQAIGELSEKYPHLDSRIIAHLGRSNVE